MEIFVQLMNFNKVNITKSLFTRLVQWYIENTPWLTEDQIRALRDFERWCVDSDKASQKEREEALIQLGEK